MGMTMEEGAVTEWLVDEGAEVEKGQEILEFETDKINARVEAPAAGILGGIAAGPGDLVKVQGLLGLDPGSPAKPRRPRIPTRQPPRPRQRRLRQRLRYRPPRRLRRSPRQHPLRSPLPPRPWPRSLPRSRR